MFTIKHIDSSNHEHLWEARPGICFAPDTVVHGTHVPPTVHFTAPDGVISSIDTGTVYVINEVGKTIARYHLTVGAGTVQHQTV
jgi:hypothetical protein